MQNTQPTQRLYNYHGTTTHAERLASKRCRCASTDDGRIFSLASLVIEGRITDPTSPGKPLTTVQAPRTWQDAVGLPPRYIFAVSASFEVNVCYDGVREEPNSVKHETLFHNAPVYAAGEIGFRDGRISSLNDLSGSYSTHGQLDKNPHFASSVLKALDGLPVAPSLLDHLQSRARNEDEGVD